MILTLSDRLEQANFIVRRARARVSALPRAEIRWHHCTRAGGGQDSGAGRMTAGSHGQMRVTAGSFGQMRASDTDRDTATGLLQTAFAEGRLTADEYDARLGGALCAQTYAELDAVTADLPGRYPKAPRTNGLAIASLACGVAQPFTGMLTTIPAIVLGHLARSQIRRSGDEGSRLATWGLLLGWGGLTFLVLAMILAVVLFAVIAVHIAAST